MRFYLGVGPAMALPEVRVHAFAGVSSLHTAQPFGWPVGLMNSQMSAAMSFLNFKGLSK